MTSTDDTGVWRLAAGWELANRQFPDEPRNFWRKAEALVRSVWTRDRADFVLGHIAENSNDLMLQATFDVVCERLPESLGDIAKEVVVFRAPSLLPGATAVRASEDERLIRIYVGLDSTLRLYSSMSRIVYRESVDVTNRLRAGGGTYDLDAVFDLTLSQLNDLRSDPSTQLSQLISGRDSWFQNGEMDPDDEFAELLSAVESPLEGGHSDVREQVDLAERFVVAHELGHHLLGHLDIERDPDRLPAKTTLQALRDFRLALGVPPEHSGLNKQQQLELDADAFASAVIGGELADDSMPYEHWYEVGLGALLALPAMDDLAIMRVQRYSTISGAPTHPSVAQRVTHLSKLSDAAWQLRTTDAPHPAGMFMQLELFTKFLATTRRPI